MAFLTGQSWRALKSLYTGGNLEQRLRRCFADGLNRSLVSSVAQATNGLVTPSLDNNVMPYRDRPLLLEGKTNQALYSVTYSIARLTQSVFLILPSVVFILAWWLYLYHTKRFSSIVLYSGWEWKIQAVKRYTLFASNSLGPFRGVTRPLHFSVYKCFLVK